MNVNEPGYENLNAEAHLSATFNKMKQNVDSVKISNASQRILKLKLLKESILSHQNEMREAMNISFKKPALETDITELLPVISHINLVVKNLSHWMKPERRPTPKELFGAKSYVIHEPKGIVLILSPWNYAFNLLFDPLVSAIAAGNCAILKPSEATPAAVKVIKKIVEAVFQPSEVYVAEGDARTASYLTSLPFDHIFFTGSPAIGRLVMKAAAENLASVTLELGGKSPAIVHQDADISKTTNSLVFAKFLNTGQTCIAPDYLLVHKDVVSKLSSALIERIESCYGNTPEAIKSSPDFGRIVTEGNYLKIKSWLLRDIGQGARVIYGGNFDDYEKYIEPTLITNVNCESALMQNEIFGPVLPILEYSTIDEALDFVKSLPKPLASYIFSKSSSLQEYVLANTTSGGTTINDCLLHNFNAHLPFGGVNNSGMGKGRGVYGFYEFSNVRGVLNAKSYVRIPELLSAPYTKMKYKIADILLRWF